ncbi:hypothetical protein GHT06_016972 [Daphnia sinensis]|uniref:Uncharacterized protein n=1 Tax=Daphnia sinensis TaxID=1820382 RepID=A0AAD5L8C2_9CRUS|nr:hypothetical protein GHT06_016972 [Daphnia sinensis]
MAHEALEFVKDAVTAGAQATIIRKFLQDTFGTNLIIIRFCPLKKPDEASFFRPKIPVRIPARTTSRQEHQDPVKPKGEDGQHHAANWARSAPRVKFASRIPVQKITFGRDDSVTLAA